MGTVNYLMPLPVWCRGIGTSSAQWLETTDTHIIVLSIQSIAMQSADLIMGQSLIFIS